MRAQRPEMKKSKAGRSDLQQGFTEDEIEELREAFNLFDTEGKGVINPQDLRSAMQSLGFETKNPIIYNIIAEMDTGEEMTFEDFLNALGSKLGDRQSKEGIARIFELFDTDKSVSLARAVEDH
eukprot:TRINITY_DN1812_c0_g1_i15.p2 TRINITY_DN1812_c0_g1~~TRINITY_DN1812_c0_g1_i15.p2  ORF type:complete len:124 (-),score=53.80 TRINITY_DN1812_c0_g1_i15:18-389(-)